MGWHGTTNVAASGAKMATVGADLGTNFSIWGRFTTPGAARQGGWVYPLDPLSTTDGATLGAVAPVRTVANEAMANDWPSIVVPRSSVEGATRSRTLVR